MITQQHTIQLAEIPFAGQGGSVWNRLHDEREDICEALLKETDELSGAHCQSLQARLRRLDDALDRLMSGSYGFCARCGHPIEPVRLALDPAAGSCRDCSGNYPRRKGPAVHHDEMWF
jgi:RNA polymerase-binding transcription factor DksA